MSTPGDFTNDAPRLIDAVKVRLLQGPVYAESVRDYEVVVRSRDELTRFFHQLGQKLIISEEDGFAYLEQMGDDEMPNFPRLFWRAKITREQAVLGVLLREKFELWSIENPDDARCIISFDDLRAEAELRIPQDPDGQRSLRAFQMLVEQMKGLSLLRPSATSDSTNPTYEILPLIKARFTPAYCEEIRTHLRKLLPADPGEPAAPAPSP
jgi:hypothetical protein